MAFMFKNDSLHRYKTIAPPLSSTISPSHVTKMRLASGSAVALMLLAAMVVLWMTIIVGNSTKATITNRFATMAIVGVQKQIIRHDHSMKTEKKTAARRAWVFKRLRLLRTMHEFSTDLRSSVAKRSKILPSMLATPIAGSSGITAPSAHLLQAQAMGFDPSTQSQDRFHPGLLQSPLALKAKLSKHPDLPSLRESLTGPFAEQCWAAVDAEIASLEGKGTWTAADDSSSKLWISLKTPCLDLHFSNRNTGTLGAFGGDARLESHLGDIPLLLASRTKHTGASNSNLQSDQLVPKEEHQPLALSIFVAHEPPSPCAALACKVNNEKRKQAPLHFAEALGHAKIAECLDGNFRC